MSRLSWRIAETLVQVFLLSLLGAGFYLVNFEIAPVIFRFLIPESVNSVRGKLLRLGYLLLSNCSLSLTLCLYLGLIYGRTSRNIVRSAAPDLKILVEPYECADMAGNMAFCQKPPCNGAWKPPRTHHCSTCGVCRVGFDHHCPWLGNDVTEQNMKSFLVFLLSVPVAFVISAAPISSVLYWHCATALSASQNDAAIRSIWWDQWYSWLFGGPLGRHVIGFGLGFRALRRSGTSTSSGGMILQPHLRIAWICWIGGLLSFFCLILAVMTARNFLRGLSTIDTLGAEAAAKILICFPQVTTSDGSRPPVVKNSTGLRPYDQGFTTNWTRLHQQTVFRSPAHGVSRTFEWPRLNPQLLKQLGKVVNGKEA